MTAEARQWRNTLRWSTNDDFFQTLSQQWAFSPKDISCYLIPGFTSSAARLVHNNTISKDVCRVLYCDVSPPPILPVLSRFIEFACHMQLYSRTVIYSLYSHTNHIHSYKSHSFIQITFIHTNHIRSYKSRSFIQLYIHTWLHQSPKVLFGRILSFQSSNRFKLPVLKKKKNGPLEFTLLILLQVVNPKQRTTWVYLSFSQRCHPLLYQKTRCHSIFHIKQISFPAWSDYRIPKFHSPLGRITEYQNFIPRFVGLRKVKKKFHSPVYRITESKKKRLPRLVGLRNAKISFPAWSDYGIPKFHSPLGRITEYQNFIPRFVGLRKVKKKFHSPVYRITESKKKRLPRLVGLRNAKISFPALSDHGISNFIPRFVGLRNIKFHSPLCRITEYQTSVFLRFVGLRKVIQVLFS